MNHDPLRLRPLTLAFAVIGSVPLAVGADHIAPVLTLLIVLAFGITIGSLNYRLNTVAAHRAERDTRIPYEARLSETAIAAHRIGEDDLDFDFPALDRSLSPR